jgi:hypothetical protein
MAPIGDPFVTNQRCRISSSLSCSRRLSGSTGKSACEQPGLCTNSPTHCLGAAAFVDLAETIGSVGVQMIALVSRCRFLGAGAIMKGGVNIRRLNTAALWCSAGVGTSAGVMRGGREQPHRADDYHQPLLGSR